ncbi:MAG: PepSY-associated TM helix domain-containing protein, partial [Pseudomonadota bacterium]
GIALFLQELEPWQSVQYHNISDTDYPQALNNAVDYFQKQVVTKETDSVFSLKLPGKFRSTIELNYQTDNKETKLHFDPITGNEIAHHSSPTLQLLEKLHTDLLLPSPYGRYLLGVLGSILLATILSGVILHRKILTQLFTLRLYRSRRLLWSDLHKVIATWSLPFLLMISITGAYLGFAEPALKTNAFVMYSGNINQAIKEFSLPDPQLSTDVQKKSISELLIVAKNAIHYFEPELVILSNYGKPHASAEVLGNIYGRIIYYPSIMVDANTGEVVKVTNWRNSTWPKLIYGMFTPLHYGSFGGTFLKIVYVIFSLLSCIIIIFGTHIWIERNQHKFVQATSKIATLLNGVYFGLPATCVAILLVSRIFHHHPQNTYTLILTLFIFIFLLFLLMAFKLETKKFRTLSLYSSAGILLLIPIWNFFVEDIRYTFTQFLSFQITPALIADGIWIALSVLLFYSANVLKKS